MEDSSSPGVVPPKLPTRPPVPTENKGNSVLAIFLAAMLLTATLAVLMFITLGAFGGVIILALLVLPAIVLFHYLLWGWWLGGVIRGEVEAEEAQAARDAAHDQDVT